MSKINQLRKEMQKELKEKAMQIYRKSPKHLSREELADVLEIVFQDNKAFWQENWGDYEAFFVSTFKKEVIKTGATLSDNLVLTKVGDRFYQFKKMPKFVTLYGRKRVKTEKEGWRLVGDVELTDQQLADLGPSPDILGGDILRKKKKVRR